MKSISTLEQFRAHERTGGRQILWLVEEDVMTFLLQMVFVSMRNNDSFWEKVLCHGEGFLSAFGRPANVFVIGI